MADETKPEVESATAKVECIVEVKPWANVIENNTLNLRPLVNGEVVTVPAIDAAVLRKNRHAVIVG